MRLNKKIIIFIAVFLSGIALLWTAFMVPATRPQSLLIEQIQTFQEDHGTDGRVDLTPVIEPHLRVGMPRSEAEELFDKMGFRTHQSWQDKNIVVADYRSSVGPPSLNIIRLYRFKLRFDKEKPTSFDGTAYTEAP